MFLAIDLELLALGLGELARWARAGLDECCLCEFEPNPAEESGLMLLSIIEALTP